MPTLLVTHPSFVSHDTGYGHPERPDRMRVLDTVFAHETFGGLVRAEAPVREDVEDWIVLAHPREHIERLRAAQPKDGTVHAHADPDTVMSAGTWEAAIRAVGAGLLAVDRIMAGEAANAFCQVRPPGHHAERRRAMGFCLFSNVAIAGLYARARYGAERIAVVDFDVHHGNGTQNIFWSDRDLFYGSTHEMPLYPGTGAVSETGTGNVWNAPLRAGDGGEAFREALEQRILPALDAFHPDFVFVSAGFDAHADDPLANLRLTEADFQYATRRLAEIAARRAGGRIVSMLEGGYDLRALARSAAVHVRELIEAGV